MHDFLSNFPFSLIIQVIILQLLCVNGLANIFKPKEGVVGAHLGLILEDVILSLIMIEQLFPLSNFKQATKQWESPLNFRYIISIGLN